MRLMSAKHNAICRMQLLDAVHDTHSRKQDIVGGGEGG